MLEDLFERLKADTIEREDYELVVNVNEAANNVSWSPSWQRLLIVTRGIEPHELSAAIIGLTELIISNAIPRMEC